MALVFEAASTGGVVAGECVVGAGGDGSAACDWIAAVKTVFECFGCAGGVVEVTVDVAERDAATVGGLEECFGR